MRFAPRQVLIAGLNLILLVLFVASAWQAPAAAQQSESPVIARITARSQQEAEQIARLGLDLLETRDGDDLFILTTEREVDRLRRLGFEVNVDPVQTAQLRRFGVSSFMGGYRTVPEMRAFLEQRAAQYPSLTRFFVYGRSWEKTQDAQAGHDLFGIELTNKQRLGPKPTLFLMAAIHARELTTSEIALRLVDYLLSNYGTDGDVTWLLDEHQIVIVPVANPDGRRLAEQGYYQRKNTNRSYNGPGEHCDDPPFTFNHYGVDLNRNSSFEWGVVNSPAEQKCSPTYPGPSAASEPETVALEQLVRSYFPDQRGPSPGDAAPLSTSGILISLHSYGELVLWPWGWSYGAAPNAGQLALLGRKMAGYNGSTPQQASDLYLTSGTTDDWAYGELGIAAFTFEIGPDYESPCGGFMPPFRCLDGGDGGAFWPRNLPALLYAAKTARAPYQLVQGPTPETLIAPITIEGVTLFAELDERHNGGQPIVEAEYYIGVPPAYGGTPVPMTAADGTFDSTRETATAVLPKFTGRRLVYVRGRDANGNWGVIRAVWVRGVQAQMWIPLLSR